MEANKLRTDEPFDYLLTARREKFLLSKIDDYCVGKFGDTHADYIRTRQNILTEYRKAWLPVQNKEIREKYNQNFNKFFFDFFTTLKDKPKHKEWVRSVILIATEQKTILHGKVGVRKVQKGRCHRKVGVRLRKVGVRLGFWGLKN